MATRAARADGGWMQQCSGQLPRASCRHHRRAISRMGFGRARLDVIQYDRMTSRSAEAHPRRSSQMRRSRA
eukprot:5670694-Alexandrium_andersonii.AAC.1